MNQNDIEAARRLIAQFEGRAVGRHNSNLDLTRQAPRVEDADTSDLTQTLLRSLQLQAERWSCSGFFSHSALSAAVMRPRKERVEDCLEVGDWVAAEAVTWPQDRLTWIVPILPPPQVRFMEDSSFSEQEFERYYWQFDRILYCDAPPDTPDCWEECLNLSMSWQRIEEQRAARERAWRDSIKTGWRRSR